jgi:hypothetical protein
VAYLSAREPAQAPPELWAIVVAWQGLAEAIGVEWLKRGRVSRAQAKVIVLESLRRLLKMQGLVRRADERSNGKRPGRAQRGSPRRGTATGRGQRP